MKKTIKIVLLGVSLLGIYISLSISPIIFYDYSKDFRETSCTIIGHRGTAGLAPENTLSSIKTALKFNPNEIEIDVQQTLDSTIILMHDITLDRTSNGTGLIKDKRYSEIKRLDAGSWFSEDFKNKKVPTLEDAIDLINGQCKLT